MCADSLRENLGGERVHEGQVHRDADADDRNRVDQADQQEHLALQQRHEFGLARGTFEELAAHDAHADCGADAKFEFADLENLIRKARIDFGAEIEFYTREQAATLFADDSGACAAVLRFVGSTLTLALTADVWRGFSGEGQALRALLRTDTVDVIARVRGALSWQQVIDPAALAAELKRPRDLVDDSLRVLGASGLVGYDLVAERYFHRVLPFDLEQIADFNPRLIAARVLVDDGAVVVENASTARVTSGGVDYRVKSEADGEARCTCPWFAKHQGDRGPCKHVLAVELQRSTSRGR